jgi:spectrin alpha
LDDGIEQADEIRQCLQHLATEQAGLNNLWEERRILYEQCMDLQLFYRYLIRLEKIGPTSKVLFF